ncbi:MAG: helix-turn-helix domain-containing protein [Clostridium sp.]|uniref:helix-turn-helix domain-containing protein n=1 Tax=Clostridium sp. TaxID=1506 RepID=UPI001DAE48A7|nr:helix-turn-helix domain-containing protein [Clostridium sp.]MBS5938231.1 helix-turn-helix domain-containing protein [Clostridium sp.]MBS5951622.1 helix-turn-helix domain-containing protein [Clostridium sp.]
MNYLDLYLQRNGIKRYDVYKATGVSQQLLSTHTSKSVEKYSNKVVIALAEALNKTPGTVLDELLALQKENPAFEAYNPAELLQGLEFKYDRIIIKGAYCSEVYKIMKGQLSETESMGFELGSAGVATVLAYAINAARDLFSNSDKVSRDIERKIVSYKLESASEENVTIRLKQLDY